MSCHNGIFLGTGPICSPACALISADLVPNMDLSSCNGALAEGKTCNGTCKVIDSEQYIIPKKGATSVQFSCTSGGIGKTTTPSATVDCVRPGIYTSALSSSFYIVSPTYEEFG